MTTQTKTHQVLISGCNPAVFTGTEGECKAYLLGAEGDSSFDPAHYEVHEVREPEKVMTTFDVSKCQEFIDSGHFSNRPALCIAWLDRAVDRIEDQEATLTDVNAAHVADVELRCAETDRADAAERRLKDLERMLARRPRLRSLEADEAAYLRSCPPYDDAVIAREHERSAYVTGLQFWARKMDRFTACMKALEAKPTARVWVGDDEPTTHPGFVEWLGPGCGWTRISGGMPLKRGCLFVPAGHPVPDGEPTSVTPCRVVDWNGESDQHK